MNNRERKFVYKLAGYDKGVYTIELEEEIERLKRRNKKLKEQYAKEEKKLFHDNEILQTRIDKAIEYIEEQIEKYDLEDGYNTCMKVIDILRGEE